MNPETTWTLVSLPCMMPALGAPDQRSVDFTLLTFHCVSSAPVEHFVTSCLVTVPLLSLACGFVPSELTHALTAALNRLGAPDLV